MGDNHNFLYVN